MASPRRRTAHADKPGVVVDASVVLKLLLPERSSDAVRLMWRQWLDQDREITAPVLLAYEVVSVLRNKVHRGELPPEAGEAAFAAFQAQEVSLVHPDGLEAKAWELAKQCELPAAYDAAYLALAELLDFEFWTADHRLAAKLGKEWPRVRLVMSRE